MDNSKTEIFVNMSLLQKLFIRLEGPRTLARALFVLLFFHGDECRSLKQATPASSENIPRMSNQIALLYADAKHMGITCCKPN